MKRIHAWVLLTAVVVSGCYRTHYYELNPRGVVAPDEVTDGEQVRSRGWRHFFLFGWVPGQKLVDAAGRCGGSDHVVSIDTRQTFVQGIISGLTVDLWSPRVGRVNCDHRPQRR